MAKIFTTIKLKEISYRSFQRKFNAEIKNNKTSNFEIKLDDFNSVDIISKE